MARIAKRLHGPALVTDSAATKYTTPAATKTIVRHVHVQNPSASAVSFTLSLGADAAAARLFDAYSIPAYGVLDHFCYYVLEATEVLQALASTTDVLVLTIDGDESIPS